MKANQAILDTGVLRNLYYLNLAHYLNMFYHRVLIPRAVEREFFAIQEVNEKQDRYDFLAKAYVEMGAWLKQCNSYDDASIQIYPSLVPEYQKKLHQGEAEVFVQNQTLGMVSELLIDEKIARKHAKNINVQTRGTLYVLARLDIQLKACDYFAATRKLRENHGTFLSERTINLVYADLKTQFA